MTGGDERERPRRAVGVASRLRRSLWIARIEIVREHRTLLERPWVAVAETVMMTVAALIVVGRVPLPVVGAVGLQGGAYHLGTTLARDSAAGPAVLATVRGFAGVVFVLVALISILQFLKKEGWRERPDGVLTAVPVGVAVLGDVGKRIATACRTLGPALVLGALAFGVAAGSPASALAILLAGASLLATGVATGYAVGMAALLGVRRSAVLREHRLVVGTPLVLVYFLVFVHSRAAGAALASLPVGWYGDAALALAPGSPAVPARAAGAAIASPLAVAGLIAVAARLGERALVADPPGPADADPNVGRPAGDASAAGDGPPSGGTDAGTPGPSAPPASGPTPDGGPTPGASEGEGLPAAGEVPAGSGRRVDAVAPAFGPVVGPFSTVLSRVRAPTRAVVRALWRRTLRAPSSLVYVLFPLVLLSALAVDLVGSLPGAPGVLVAVYGGLTVGLGVTLNPLGNEGVALPALLTTPGGGRALVRGYVLSAVLPGAPVVAVATAVAGLAAPSLGAVALLLSIVLSVVTALAGPAVATAIGTKMPAARGTDVTTSRELRPPEMYALSVYLFVMGLAGAPALAGLYWARVRPAGPATGIALAIALMAAVGIVGYRRAVATIDDYRVDEEGP